MKSYWLNSISFLTHGSRKVKVGGIIIKRKKIAENKICWKEEPFFSTLLTSMSPFWLFVLICFTFSTFLMKPFHLCGNFLENSFMQYSLTAKKKVIEKTSEPLLNIMCFYLTTTVIRANYCVWCLLNGIRGGLALNTFQCSRCLCQHLWMKPLSAAPHSKPVHT